MSDSSSYSDETPPLPFAAFDPIDSEETEAGHRDENDDAVEPPVKAASESKGSLDRIVTRLDDNRPPKWAMNWRPTGEEAEAAEASGDHHPARIAATEAPMPHESPEETDTAVPSGELSYHRALGLTVHQTWEHNGPRSPH